jgi:hypothetical protein
MRIFSLLSLLITIGVLAAGCNSECQSNCEEYYYDVCPVHPIENCSHYCDDELKESKCNNCFACLSSHPELCQYEYSPLSQPGDPCWDEHQCNECIVVH